MLLLTLWAGRKICTVFVQFTTAVIPDSYKIFILYGAKHYINECNSQDLPSPLRSQPEASSSPSSSLPCREVCVCYNWEMGEWQDKKPVMFLSFLCKYMLQMVEVDRLPSKIYLAFCCSICCRGADMLVGLCSGEVWSCHNFMRLQGRITPASVLSFWYEMEH